MSRIPQITRSVVLERDSWCCVVCGSPRELVIHHRQGRRRRDPHCPSNLVTLCTPHHRDVHAHPTDSYESGLMVRRTGMDDPAEIPVRTDRGLLWLIEDGTCFYNVRITP